MRNPVRERPDLDAVGEAVQKDFTPRPVGAHPETIQLPHDERNVPDTIVAFHDLFQHPDRGRGLTIEERFPSGMYVGFSAGIKFSDYKELTSNGHRRRRATVKTHTKTGVPQTPLKYELQHARSRGAHRGPSPLPLKQENAPPPL